MKSQTHVPHAVFKNAFGITDQLKPLKQRKSPSVASVCGFTFGGLGLGLYFGTWTDFFLPVAIWLVIMVLAAPTGELLLITAPVFCAIYGFRRATASNRKLDAGGTAERIIDAEVITAPPPIPAVPKAIDAGKTPQARLRQADDLFRGGSISQSEYADIRATILSEL